MDTSMARSDDLLKDDRKAVTLDDVVAIFTKTVLNPFGCWCFALYYLLRDVGSMVGFSGNSISKECVYGVGFALVIEGFYLLVFFNSWWISGFPKTTAMTPDSTVVITGGSQGLGQKIAGILGVRGYKVVILDIMEPKTLIPNTKFIQCDVADQAQVEAARRKISAESKVSVLINNAAIVPTKGSVMDHDPQTIKRTLDVNVTALFWTTKAFVPEMIKRGQGHVVNISSVIGSIGPANLSIYAASKGAVNSFHDSLTHEIRQLGIKTLLVTPGQLDTPMFHGVKTPSEFLAPIVRSLDLASAIVSALERGQCGQLSLPLYASLINWTKVLPQSIIEIARTVFKMDRAMDTFIGNQ